VTAVDLRLDHLAIATRFAAAPEQWPVAPRFTPVSRWYERLHVAEDHEVWLLTWLPGQGTDLHDHGGSWGAFVVIAGTLTEETVTAGTLTEQTVTARTLTEETVTAGALTEQTVTRRQPLGGTPTARQLALRHGGRAAIRERIPGRTRTTEDDVEGGAVRVVSRELGEGAGRRFGPWHIHRVTNRSNRPATSIHVYGPALTTMTRYRLTAGRLEIRTVEAAGVQW
jgi:hypothetical protein